MSCADNAVSPVGSSSGDACKCKANMYRTEMWTCWHCPQNATSPAGTTDKFGCICSAGTYFVPSNPNDGTDNRCVPCASGTYSAATGATSVATCLECPANTYAATGAKACTACPQNTFSYPRATQCLLLVNTNGDCANSYSYTLVPPCTPCPVGTGASCESGGLCQFVTDCRCNSGTFGPDGGPCTRCHDNSGANCQLLTNINRRCGSDEACFCNVGYEGPVSGTVCKACAGGTYKATNANGDVCTNCPANTYSIKGATSAAACVACPVGKISASGSSTCVCKSNTYNYNEGCVSCGDGSVSSGLGYESSCVCGAGFGIQV